MTVMDGRDFLGAARVMRGRGPACSRSAISRAYYAAFRVAAALLRHLECRVPRLAEGHGVVPALLDRSGVRELETAAVDLRHLREQRNWADYELEYEDAEADQRVDEAILIAEDVIGRLDAFRTVCRRYPRQVARLRQQSVLLEQDLGMHGHGRHSGR